MVALFEICFRSLLFDVEKRRQKSEINAIHWDLYNKFYQERCFWTVSGLEEVDDKPVIAWSLVQLTISLTRGNLRCLIILVERIWKIMTPLSYHSSNFSLIAIETMRLLAQKLILHLKHIRNYIKKEIHFFMIF